MAPIGSNSSTDCQEHRQNIVSACELRGKAVRSAMAKKSQTDWEKAARALCTFHGLPENTMHNGRPMWMSYLAEAKVVLVAIGSFDEPDAEPEGGELGNDRRRRS